MPDVRINVRGAAEANNYLANLVVGLREIGGTTISVGTPLPRGLFTDVGTSRGTRATHWLSGLSGRAKGLAGEVLASKLRTPLELARAIEAVGEKIAAMARGRAPQRTGRLRREIGVTVSRGALPGLSRLGRR